jgi:endonuclease YncB( thermonuclease family)
LTLASLAVGLTATAAAADPCHYVPEHGPLPRELQRGAAFGGPVRWIIAGDALCLGGGSEPRTWIEVQLEGVTAPPLASPGGTEAKTRLERVSRGRRADCVAHGRAGDRIVAVCRIGDASLAQPARPAR